MILRTFPCIMYPVACYMDISLHESLVWNLMRAFSHISPSPFHQRPSPLAQLHTDVHGHGGRQDKQEEAQWALLPAHSSVSIGSK